MNAVVLRHPMLLRRLALPVLSGRGKASAPLVWLYLASKLRWRTQHTRVWPSNATIASATGLPQRVVEAALATLRAAGKISTEYGYRGRKYHRGRIITLHLLGDGPVPIVVWPRPSVIAGIRQAAESARSRPASLVSLAVAITVAAAAEHGGDVAGKASTHMRLAVLRELVGAAHGSTFTRRLEALASAGIISRMGGRWSDGISLHVPELASEDVVADECVIEATLRCARSSIKAVRERWETRIDRPARGDPDTGGRLITLEELDLIHGYAV